MTTRFGPASMADGRITIGSVIGNYRIERVLGEGGFGTVYLAEDVRPQMAGRRVALKVLRRSAEAGFRDRFLRESVHALRLGDEHPNIVRIFEADEFDGHLFIAMQFVDGPDLDRLIDLEGPLPPALVVSVTEQVANALHTVHQRGMVHRDVKPGNILLSADRARVYLADFGVTKHLGGIDPSLTVGQQPSTVLYAAPEQLDGHAAGPAADVYALGAVVFHALAGRPPFEGPVTVIINAHVTRAVPSLVALRPDLPRGIDGVVARAMAKDLHHRHPTAAALAADLRGVLTPPPPRPPPPPPEPRPPRSRTGWIVAVGVAAVAVVAMVALLLLPSDPDEGDSFPNSAESELVASVDRAERGSCERDDDADVDTDEDVLAAVRCDGGGDGVDELRLTLFASGRALDDAFDEARDDARVVEGVDCALVTGVTHEYAGSGADGDVVCSDEAMIWSETGAQVLGVIEGDDRSSLYAAWEQRVDRDDPPAANPDVASSLMTTVPRAYRGTCVETSAGRALPEVQAALECDDDGFRIVFLQFDTLAALDDTSAEVATLSGVDDDTGGFGDCPFETPRFVAEAVRGRARCFDNGGQLLIANVDRPLRVLTLSWADPDDEVAFLDNFVLAGPLPESPAGFELGTSDLQINLLWGSTADLDLALIDAAGVTLAQGTLPAFGATFGGDANPGCESTGSFETILWEGGVRPPPGSYTVRVIGFRVGADECGSGEYGLEVFGLTDEIVELSGEVTDEVTDGVPDRDDHQITVLADSGG